MIFSLNLPLYSPFITYSSKKKRKIACHNYFFIKKLIPPLRLNKYSTTIKHRGEMLKKPTNRENVTSPLINYGNNTFYYFLSLPTIAPINNRYWKKILSFIVFLSWHFILSAQIESTYYIPMPEKANSHTSFKVFTDAQNFGTF